MVDNYYVAGDVATFSEALEAGSGLLPGVENRDNNEKLFSAHLAIISAAIDSNSLFFTWSCCLDYRSHMKILYLSKRFYTNKDLLAERYGRVFEFSRGLAAAGHSVTGCALDYRRNVPDRELAVQEVGLQWRSYPLFPGPLRQMRRYLDDLHSLIRAQQPDVLLSSSDVYHVILGDRLARKHSIAHFVDLYDNYESFGASRVPGITARYRQALRRAAGVSCVSKRLGDYLLAEVGLTGRPEVIINAVDLELFQPMDMTACRQQLGLPVAGRVIGLGGAISEHRAASTLFAAHRELLEAGLEVHLALAGTVDRRTTIPRSDYVHYLGELDYRTMPVFFAALDVGVITNSDNQFSRYCFPQKYFELRACERPVVIAATGDVRDYTQGCEQSLFTPGDRSALLTALRRQLDAPCLAQVDVPDWTGQGARLASFLEKMQPHGA